MRMSFWAQIVVKIPEPIMAKLDQSQPPFAKAFELKSKIAPQYPLMSAM